MRPSCRIVARESGDVQFPHDPDLDEAVESGKVNIKKAAQLAVET